MCEYINGAIIQEDFTMEKTIYDESNGLWYELRGDYYIPCDAMDLSKLCHYTCKMFTEHCK